jgi:basic membrane protein A
MKKGISTVVVIAIVIVLVIAIAVPLFVLMRPAGPGPTITVTVTTSSPTTPTKKLKIAFLTTTDETDLGWSKSVVDAANYANLKYGFETNITRFTSYADAPRIMSDYAEKGFDIIWTMGAEYHHPEVAQQYPNTHFVSINPWSEVPANMIGITEVHWEGSYLAGVLAAYMTKTKAIGHIMGENYVTLHMSTISFEAGIHSVDPTIKFYSVYAGSWSDASLGYSIAEAMIEEHNVDIIMQEADVTGRGVVSACVDKGIMVIGVYGDQSALAPANTLTSVDLKTYVMLDTIIKIYQAGKWSDYGGKLWEMGLAEGTVDLAPFHEFETKVPQAARDAIEAAKQGIINGTIQMPGKDVYPGYPRLSFP